MIIAIDYDDTYTRDPLLWNWFIQEAMSRDHVVYCVTARHERQIDEVKDTIGLVIGADRCIATGSESKRRFVYDLDIIPDVWIDDIPESIIDIGLLRLTN